MKPSARSGISFILILGIFMITTTFSYSADSSAASSIQVYLIYPQASNMPKRETRKIEKPVILKGEVFINAAGINPEQVKDFALYLEYFLDNVLVYSTESKNLDKTKSDFSGFILNTCLYPDGEHTLVVNLWNKDGPSAIGMRKIIIQNNLQNEN